MARARNIKPGLFKNEILGEANPLYTILFAGLWCLADKSGRLEDRPKRIKAEVFPYRFDLDASMALAWLNDNSFIKRYTIDGENYIQILKWRKHQAPHHKETNSVIPDFKECNNIEENQQHAQAKAKHGSSMVQACVKHNASCPTDSLNLIPDSLNLIPEVNTSLLLQNFEPNELTLEFIKSYKLPKPESSHIASFISHHEIKKTFFKDGREVQAAFKRWMSRQAVFDNQKNPGGNNAKQSASELHAEANAAAFEQ